MSQAQPLCMFGSSCWWKSPRLKYRVIFFHPLHQLNVNEYPIIYFLLVYISVNGRKNQIPSTLKKSMKIKSFSSIAPKGLAMNLIKLPSALCKLLCHLQTSAFIAALQNHLFTKWICVPEGT